VKPDWEWRLRCHKAKKTRPTISRIPAAAAPMAAPAVAPVLRERVVKVWMARRGVVVRDMVLM